MKKNTYSFTNLAAINIGSMIGVGIFFKNPGILTTTNNIYLAIATWIIGGILMYGIGLSFAEAHSYTGEQGESGTIANWVTTFVGPKTGRIADQIMAWLYYPVFSALSCYYAIYFFLMAFGWETGVGKAMETQWIWVWAYIILSYLILAIGNALSYGFGKITQLVGTIIKFIPLIIVCVIGFTAPLIPAGANTFAGFVANTQDKIIPQTWNFGSIFLALPAVFFAFDGFFGGLALSKEESTKGDAAKASLFSIVSVGIFYVLFSAAVGFGTNNGDLFPLFENSFGATGAKILYLIIGVSAYVVGNGMMISGSRQIKATSDAKAFLPSKFLSKVESDGRHIGQTWIVFAIGTFFMTLSFVIAEILSAGATAETAAEFTKELTFDNLGNAITLLAFILYAFVGFGVFANRFTNQFKVVKQKWIVIQLLSALITMWVIIQNVIGYFLAVSKTTMWMLILSVFVIWATNLIVTLANKEYL